MSSHLVSLPFSMAVDSVFFFSEYMPGGNLYNFLHKQNDVLGLLLVLKIAIQISKGMEYLHQNSIIHRDLKTANILIGLHNQVCILIQTIEAIGSEKPRVHFFCFLVCGIKPGMHI